MKRLLNKIDFGNEAADDVTVEELSEYFVTQDVFDKSLSLKNKIILFTAKKGVGKSALLKWYNFKYSEIDDNIVIWLRGADLARSQFKIPKEPKTPNEYIRDWMIRLATITNRHIARKISFAFTDDDMTLVEAAEIDGFKEKNFFGSLIVRFEKLLTTMHPSKQEIKSELEIFKRKKEYNIIFLVDDLDATFQNTDQEKLEISSFFSACRYLTQDHKGVHFRVTLRADVWPLIRRFDESLDKFDQYVKSITWSKPEFAKIIDKRIISQVQSFFKNDDEIRILLTNKKPKTYRDYIINPQMRWGQKDVDSYQILYTLSYERPRWGIQLLKLSQQYACDNGNDLITKMHIDKIWGDYGKKRIFDLVSEHKHQCNEIEEIITAFRGADRKMNRDELFILINNKILNHLTPIVEGKSIKSPVDLASFIFRIGFIIARSESDDDYHYQHYHFDEMPDFLTSRTDTDFGVLWEIHPCYREALDIKKLDEYQKIKRYC